MVVEALGAAVVFSGWGMSSILLAEQKLDLITVTGKKLASLMKHGQGYSDNEDLKMLDGSLVKLKILFTKIKGIVSLAVVDEVVDSGFLMWLNHLQHSAYLAEDFIDKFHIKYIEGSRTYSDVQLKKYFKKARKEIIALLTNADSLIDDYGCFRDSGMLKGLDSEVFNRRYESTGYYFGEVIFGREDDIEKLLVKVAEVACRTVSGVYVISIVGITGIGKTTVAQSLFHNRQIVNQYLRAWFSMHEDFHLDTVLKGIIESLTGVKYEVLDSHRLHAKFLKQIHGKRIFLVLDNARHVVREDWSALLSFLKYAANGSVLVVTTQNPMVSQIIGSQFEYNLPKLSEEDCWSVFQQSVFPSEEYGTNHRKLCDVGREIVKKCYGLPLIADTLGHFLFSQDDVKEWEHILTTGLSNLPVEDNAIARSLRQCYFQLPNYLKVLVPYCGILPIDFQFEKETLVQLWMAEELVQPKGNMDLEDLGSSYFDELVKRGLFLRSSNRDGSKFVVHGLIYDMLQLVNLDGSFRAVIRDKSDLVRNTEFVRYVSIHMDGFKFQDLQEFKRLRTIVLLSENRSVTDVFYFMPYMKHVRVLDLSHSSITEVPSTIDRLEQLRYLDVSHTPVMSIDEKLYDICKLQTLKVRGCRFRKLPPGIGKCGNLRHLDLDENSEFATPPDIGKLTQLQELRRFAVLHDGCRIDQLKDLNMIKGSLCISGLEDVGLEDVVLAGDPPSYVKEKAKLERLKLEWTSLVPGNVGEWIAPMLQPHSNLKELVIKQYPLHNWNGQWNWGSTSSLEKIELLDCENLRSIAGLRELPFLKTLTLQGNGLVENFDITDFFVFEEPHSGLQSLEEFSVISFRACTKWTVLEVTHMPKLGKLSIRGCPLLTTVPDFSSLPLMKELNLVECNSLRYSAGSVLPPQATLNTHLCHHLEPCGRDVQNWPFTPLPAQE